MKPLQELGVVLNTQESQHLQKSLPKRQILKFRGKKQQTKELVPLSGDNREVIQSYTCLRAIQKLLERTFSSLSQGAGLKESGKTGSCWHEPHTSTTAAAEVGAGTGYFYNNRAWFLSK